MRVVIQRVNKASVTISNNIKSSINQGLLIFLGITNDDSKEDAKWLINKILKLRIFDDAQGIMNKNIIDIHGDILVVSQFTLMASYKKGNRPSYIHAAKPEVSKPLYEFFCKELSIEMNHIIQTGEFGTDMKVELINDGPVTICMDTKNKE